MKIPLKFISKIKKIKVSSLMGIPSNLQYNTKIINESGLYYILSISNKPLAKLFMDKYINEIMPQTSTLKGYKNWTIYTRF